MKGQSMKLSVSRVVDEASGARVIELVCAPAEHAEEFAYRPGQAVAVLCPNSDARRERTFFLSSSPECDRFIQFVAPEADASAGNLHSVEAGDLLEVALWDHGFVPADPHVDLAMFARGSGIAPLISIAKSHLASGTAKVVLFYANSCSSSVLFHRELQFLAEDHPDRLTVLHLLEDLQGTLDPAQFESMARPYRDREIYLCGERGFTETLATALAVLDVPAARIHAEPLPGSAPNRVIARVASPGAASTEREALLECSTDPRFM